MSRTPSEPAARWVRIVLVLLGLPNAMAGAWAIVAPHSWFDRFPGWDPRLVAADPPYNAHLATDAGAGLLASGLVLLAAAWLADRRSVQLALVAFLGFAIPHGVFHALHDSPGLSDAEGVQNAATLVGSVALAVVLLVVTARDGTRPDRADA